jgi:HK97 family phage major capsid protein
MADINDLLQQRNRLVEEGRKVLETAEAENRELSDEEKANDDARFEQVKELDRQMESLRRAERYGDAPVIESPEPVILPEVEPRKEKTEEDTEQEVAKEVRDFLRYGVISPNSEQRALSLGLDVEGGYTAPDGWNARLIQAVDNLVFIRQRATVYQLGTGSRLEFPSLAADPADPTWVAELAIGSEDSTMSFGNRALSPHPMAIFMKISKTILRQSALNVEAIVRDRLAYKASVVQEKGFLTGSGAGQPLGLFTASGDGISTSRDVSSGNATDSIKFDGLIAAQYELKGQYWNRADWLFHRDALEQIRKLKDGEGQYVWQPGGQAGEPDRLLGRPFIMSEYVPSTFSSGLYVGCLGDYSNYWIVDSLSVSLQRLVELYAATNQIGIILRAEADGMPVLEEAFVRVTLA